MCQVIKFSSNLQNHLPQKLLYQQIGLNSILKIPCLKLITGASWFAFEFESGSTPFRQSSLLILLNCFQCLSSTILLQLLSIVLKKPKFERTTKNCTAQRQLRLVLLQVMLSSVDSTSQTRVFKASSKPISNGLQQPHSGTLFFNDHLCHIQYYRLPCRGHLHCFSKINWSQRQTMLEPNKEALQDTLFIQYC